ncbi:hypothetical protein POPTR_003G155300v4 [Populus trichocarpa]|uniref:Uncharacterized protein n=1 Tax=Populus trichocarpa TaxID=3694 RepID=A0A2K2B7Q7_POPTR|nr:hypothetical protein POPTR_003G155300v4 [Populus trichocarpa]
MAMITCMTASLKKLVSLFLVITFIGKSCVFGHFVVEKSNIRVLSPLSLMSKHDSAIGNFGIPDYGGYLVGSVVYPDKGALCHLAKQLFGCVILGFGKLRRSSLLGAMYSACSLV